VRKFHFFIVGDLKVMNIMKVFNDEFSSGDAMKLGTYLDIPHSKLKEFKKNHTGDVGEMLLEVLNYWLENDSEKSWPRLADAVKYCGYKNLAEKIKSRISC